MRLRTVLPPLLLLCASMGQCSEQTVASPLQRQTLELEGPRGGDMEAEARINATATARLNSQFRDQLMESVATRLAALRQRHLFHTGSRWQHPRPDGVKSHHRMKRDHPVPLPLTRDPHGVYVLEKVGLAVPQWRIPAPGAQHVHLFTDSGTTYALAAYGVGFNSSLLLQLQDDKWTVRSNLSSFGALRFTTFARDVSTRASSSLHGHRFLIGAEYECVLNRPDKRGPVLSAFQEGGEIEFQHVLPVLYPTDVAIWNDYTMLHVGVAAEMRMRPDGTPDYHVNSSIFKWADGNFRQHQVPTYGARDIEHFRIQSHLFIMIANHQNNEGALNVHSEILRYSLGTGEYRPFQRILTRGAVRSRHFVFGSGVGAEHFLVVANQADKEAGDEYPDYQVDSVVYKFSHGQFVPFQCLPTVGALDVLPLWGPRGEFVLALADSRGVHLYQYTGWRFALVTTIPSNSAPPLTESSIGGVGLSAYIYQGHLHLAVGAAGGGSLEEPAVYRLRFLIRSDLARIHQQCERWCRQLSRNLTNLIPRVAELQSAVAAAPRLDQPITFNSLTVHSEGGATFANVSITNLHLNANETLNSGVLERLESLRRRLQQSNASIQQFRAVLANAVYLDEDFNFTQNVVVAGAWEVHSASVQALTVRRLAELREELSRFLSKVVWIDQPFSSTLARLRFQQLVIADGTSLQVGTLSHVNPAYFVTLSGDHEISGSTIFHGGVRADDVTITGAVNGVVVNATTVIQQGSLPANVTQLGDVSVNNLYVRRINGKDVATIVRETVFKNATLWPAVGFLAGLRIETGHVRYLNGVAVDRFLRYSLKTTGDQNITGSWTISDLHAQNDVTATGLLNGLRVPEDLVLIADPALTYHLSAAQFTHVSVQALTVTRTLGPIQVSADGQLLVLLRSGGQVITGHKTIGTVHLAADSAVHGLINGVRVSADGLQGAINQTTAVIEGDKVVHGSVVFLANLDVRQLNNISVTSLLASALRLDATILPPMRFLNDLEIDGDLKTSHLNGAVPADWVRTDGDAPLITGRKVFSTLTAAAGLFVDTLNGVQLDAEFYAGVLTTAADQQLLGELMFVEHVQFSRLTAGSVDWRGYDLQRAVTVYGNHAITGPKFFTAPLQVTSPQIQHLKVDGLIDGTNLTQLLTLARVNDTHTIINGSQTFGSLVTVSDITVDILVNGVSLVALLTEAVRDGGTVQGDVLFTGDVTVDNLTFTGTLDGVPAADFGSAWLTTAGGQTFQADLTSLADVTVTSLTLDGTLNGVPGDQLLAGLVKIEPGMVIAGDLIIDTLVTPSVTIEQPGINFTDVVLQNQSQIILGEKLFLGGVFAFGPFDVTGDVNGVALQQVCARVIRTDRSNRFTRLTVNGSVTLHSVSDVLSWTLNGVDLGRLEELVWLRDVPTTLQAPLILTEPTLNDVHVQTLLVGSPPLEVDLDHYLINFWSASRPVTLTGHVTFASDVTVETLVATEMLNITGYLNGYNVSHLLTSALTVDGGAVTGLWNFENIIVTDSLTFSSLNGAPASALAQVVSGQLRFSSVQTVGQLTVHGDLLLPSGGQILGLDVSEQFRPSNFLLHDAPSAVVNASIVVPALHVQHALSVLGLVNGIRFHSSQLLTVAEEQTVLGTTTIQHVGAGCLNIAQLAAPLVNGVDVQRLFTQAVRAGSSYTVTALWTFINPPTVGSVQHPNSDQPLMLQQLALLQQRALTQLSQVNVSVAQAYVPTVERVYGALLDAREQLRVASYLQYYVLIQSWREEILRFVPVYFSRGFGADPPEGGDAPAFLLALRRDSLTVLNQRHNVDQKPAFTTWTDGARHAEAEVVWAAGLRTSAGRAYVAAARLKPAPAGVYVPDQLFSWNHTALSRLEGATNNIYRYDGGRLVGAQQIPSHKTTDVKALQPEPDTDCLLFVHFAGNSSQLVCRRADADGFSLHQQLHTSGGREASVYRVEGETCVAVASSRPDAASSHPSAGASAALPPASGSGVDLWCWWAAGRRLTLRQRIETPATGVSVVEFGAHVVMAVTEAARFKSDGVINIYRYEPVLSKFVHVQTLPVASARAVRLHVLPSGELLLLCLTGGGRVRQFQYGGAAWFQARGALPAAAATASSLEVFRLEGLHAQLAVGGPAQSDMFRLETRHPAALYSAKFMGHEW